MTDSLHLIAFKAPERPDLCAEFLHQHELVLAELGIPLVVKADESWIHDPSCYVIVANHPSEGMVGGIRLQLDHDPTRPLPLAVSLSELAPDIHSLLDQLRPFGNGEVCGLWSASRYAKRGVTVLLSLAVTAIAPMVGADRLVCFVGHHTKRHPEKNGFVAMTGIGNSGVFDYPTSEFQSIVMVNPDTILLPHADPEHRKAIYSLRLRPVQGRMEQPARMPIEVNYGLMVAAGLLDLVAYRMISEERLRHTG
ncbi:MAG: hypothetical protein IPK99_00110 [Flavobacteriales bacterium]|nr:hypothetical protein [Flavobacteriales bacterium]